MNDRSRSPIEAIEPCAKISAALERGASVDGALERAGLTRGSWRQAKQLLLDELEAEMRTGRNQLAGLYLAALDTAPGTGGRTGSTDELDVRRIEQTRHDGAIPFVAPPPTALDKTSARPTFDDLDPSGDTLADDDAPVPSLPFARGAEHTLMSLDRYAEMAAHLRANPGQAASVLARFGLDTTEQRDRVHQLWRLRFDANSELYERFLAAVEQKFAALATNTPQ